MSSDNTPIDANTTNNPPQIPSATPRKTVTGGRSRKITDLRTHIGAEMNGEFVTCDIDTFISHYLPFVPEQVHVTTCVEKILKPKKVMDKTQTPVFTAFRDTPAINKTVVGQRTEREVFRPLETIAKHISTFKFPGKSRLRNKFSYRNVPHDTIKSDIEGSDHNVDACFTKDKKAKAKRGDRRINTWAMAVPIEQKVPNAEKKKVDNNEKLLSANVQIMNDDVRRMFTFGITFDADQMTLWYHSRSHSAISQSFSFVKDPERLIKIFMSFLFATEQELGYDPNVERLNNGNYIFKFIQKDESVRFYRTADTPISFYRSNNITGRMPTVWVVESYDPATKKTGGQFVLKDVWIEQHAQTECQIQSAIFDDINKFGAAGAPADSPGLRRIWDERKDLIRSREYQQLFLKIEDDFIDKVASKTIALGSRRMFGLFTSPMRSYASKNTFTRSEAGQYHAIHNPSPENIDRVYESKKRYRLVFNEICRSVGDLETLGEAIDVIQQAHIALQLLYCAGWVHRDISDGNILAYRPDLNDASLPWKAKLMDLEYAKKFPPPDNYEASVDPKTGTPYFMPSEILARSYLLLDVPVEVGEEATDVFPDTKPLSNASPDTKSIVIHNFQHDLESFWWLILWLITSHVHDQPRESWPNPDSQATAIYSCQIWMSPIFQNILTLEAERRGCLAFSIEAKLGQILPANLADHAWRFEFLRKALYTTYLLREGQGKIRDKESYANIHLKFGDFLLKLQNDENKDWRAYVLKQPPTTESEKTDVSANISTSAAADGPVPALAKLKAKRGPDQNPNLQEQGRAGASRRTSERSRKGT